MGYKCSRSGCNKTAASRAGLKCQRCDPHEARAVGVTPIYDQPPGYSQSLVTGSNAEPESSCKVDSGGGGDFGGGGASGDF